MAGEHFGLAEGVSIALGGMIGGGIFAVLGVLAQITHAATWAAFVVAGVIAACAAYSYIALNRICDQGGGSVTFVQGFTGNTTVAGMVGWTILFGYVGSMAMYAYAFGSYAVGFAAVPDAAGGVGLRPVVSVLVVAAFVGLNLLGARATGSAENVMVGIKVAVLVAMGVGGIYYGATRGMLEFGFDRLAPPSLAPLTAAAVSFVAFQGWQLLFYDQESIEDPVNTIRKAVYVAIPSAVALYVVVAITTISLAPAEIVRTHPERALAVAAEPFLPYGFVVISLAALFSTGSAINATMFSAGYLAKGMLSEDLLPDRAGDSSASGVPGRTLVLLGVVTAGFAAVGSLGAITSFASLAFVVVFGGVCVLALRQRERESVRAAIPALGAVGTGSFFILTFWHLFRVERTTFYAVLGISLAVLALELLYFERDLLAEEIAEVESAVEDGVPLD